MNAKKRFGIVVDSGCDLKAMSGEHTTEIAFSRAPLKLEVGEKEFVDDIQLDVKQYMQEMYAYPGKTGSAAPSPGEWCQAYEMAEDVFAITLTGSLSGSYQSAMAAKDMILEKYPQKKICVIDSKSAGPELTLIVLQIQKCIKAGWDFEKITEEIERYQKRTHLFFVLESLDNFVKNGRVSKLQGSMAGLLGIKILGCASEQGTLEVMQKCRGKLTAYEKLVQEMIKRGYQGSKVIISHCFNEEKAEYIKSLLCGKFPQCDIEIMPTSGLCSYYAERGGVLLAFETE